MDRAYGYLQMTKPSRQRRMVRREFVIGDVNECTHPTGHRTYLGNQSATAFYQCQRCEVVLISTAQGRRSSDEENHSRRS